MLEADLIEADAEIAEGFCYEIERQSIGVIELERVPAVVRSSGLFEIPGLLFLKVMLFEDVSAGVINNQKRLLVPVFCLSRSFGES